MNQEEKKFLLNLSHKRVHWELEEESELKSLELKTYDLYIKIKGEDNKKNARNLITKYWESENINDLEEASKEIFKMQFGEDWDADKIRYTKSKKDPLKNIASKEFSEQLDKDVAENLKKMDSYSSKSSGCMVTITFLIILSSSIYLLTF